MNRFLKLLFLLLVVLAMGRSPAARAEEKKPVNLLRLSSVKLERSTALPGEQASLTALTDDDPGTAAEIKAPGGSVEVVYGFGGAVVTPERLVVHLPQQAPPGSATDRVEVLVSTVSAQAGFHSLRADPLKPTGKPQEFSFPPTGARWIMLRFTTKEKAKGVAIAEVAVLGQEGAPASHYAFKESPVRAFDVLARLKKSSSLDVSISRDEAALFADVKDGKFNKWSYGEAALLASGVTDAEKRKGYLKRLDALEGQARKAVAGAKTAFEKGEKLLAWLHGENGPLTKGYASGQTDLSGILDTGTFNCVSSAVLYNVLGRSLELDVRAIEVPDHAFSILYEGTRHADVETTTAGGFDPARDEAAQVKLKETTGFRYIADSNRDQRREVGEAGLVAIIYYNHGVTLTQEKRHHEALLAYFRAMSLDREFASAVKNALASLANWSGELAGEGKFEAAHNVLAAGLDLAPKDALLLHNRKAVWGQWAEAASKAGKDDEAADILRRAAAEVPDGNFRAMQAWIYIRRGEEFVKAGDWGKALAAVEPGFKKVDEGPRKELRDWAAGLPLRWSQAEMDKKNYEKAVEVLQAARTRQPKDDRLTNNLVYAVQEWARDAHAKDGEEKAKAILLGQIKHFPEITELQEVASNHASRVVGALRHAGKYEECLAAVERHKEFLKGKDKARDLAASVFDAWANKLTADKKWTEAVGVYEKGLKRLPGDGHLKTNLVYTMQEWVKDVYAAAGDEKARAVLLGLRKRFPGMPEVDELAKSHVQRVVGGLLDAGKFPEALAAIAANKELLKDKDDPKALAYTVYDGWAEGLKGKKDWQGAVDMYAKGLGQYPKDSHLSNNAVATWVAWAATLIDKKDWAGAIKVYEKALKQFPDDGTLKNNLDYCKEQMKKK